ncbi:MAG: DNA-processing protein DprA [Planctomycetes bacterium]|nr:DNA-processing protein DprA [Planctomycetota bacterium]
MDRIEEALRLASCPGIGPRTYLQLRNAFGSNDAILGASVEQLCEVDGVGKILAEKIARAHEYDPRQELEAAARQQVQLIDQDNPAYPPALKTTFDPPILLYVKGSLRPSDAIALAIVGTRQPSRYGRAQAERFSALLARTGFTIVSGLARGIDSAAHRSALVAGGRTLAILGSGIGNIYPEENRDLAAEISQNGAVISEFPMQASPARENFPRRNRLIAGMTLGTLVVEGPTRSGSLITARLANELGREIFAIPGQIDHRNAEGCNALIAQGQAKLVTGLDDILEELGPLREALQPSVNEDLSEEHSADLSTQQSLMTKEVAGKVVSTVDELMKPPSVAPGAGSEKEITILNSLGEEEMHIDDLCVQSGLPVHEVSGLLMIMELKGLVRQHPGNFVARHK